ncbi:uncharacterized protein LOC104900913 [Beta vulgaris subsp. vulgaris]|uniref:uncharacterized protein LOC104900913 n=1 Tax=Beta vulgaris subsp. vulgaris TaxID=3555 RepID=UPI00053FCF89|nr:uncharacterized protein LOC104900913 [Beta vulgaris subsp. vulgaris]
MKKNAWEIIENPPWNFHYSHSRSVTNKNSLHWIDQKFLGSPILIRSFDLFTRKYDEIELPSEINPSYSRLAVFQGELHLVTDDVFIWKMKNDCIMEKIWSSVKNNDFDPEILPSSFHVMLCPTPFFSEGEIQATNLKKEVEKIFCFDLESKEKFEVEIEGLPNEPKGFHAESWAESLVPLD